MNRGEMFSLLLLSTLLAVSAAVDPLRMCAKTNFYEECQQLTRSEEIRCNRYYNNIDCMLSLNNGTSNFGKVTPDEAILGSKVLNNLQVIGEIRTKEGENRSSDFEIVVLIKDRRITSFGDLKGRRFCHPGYGKLNLPRYMLNKFEETLIDSFKPKFCNSKVNTTLERHIAALSEFLGPSCRPGPWSDNDEMDKRLKSTYPNLCVFCNKGCSGDEIHDPFSAALDCLDKDGGDVAITTTNELARRNWTLAIYMCPDGSVGSRPCPWAKRSWPLILANKNTKDASTLYLKEIFGRSGGIPRKIDTDLYVVNIIKPVDTEKIVFLDVDLKSYVKNLNAAPEKPRCDRKLRWCVVSEEEYEKCRWLDEASIAQGIYINIECQRAEDRLACLEKIRKKDADIAAINNTLGYAARRKFLKAVAFPETINFDLSRTMVVVKSTSSDQIFSTFRGQKACFAEFGDIAFMSFMARIKAPSECDYGKITNNFMGESCIPGTNDPQKEATPATDVSKLCGICNPSDPNKSITCRADHENEYFGNNGALRCLKTVGDYAVITNTNITEYLDDDSLRVLCKNGSLASHSGLRVDDECYLSITTSSELVTRIDFDLFNDSILALAAYEQVFGRNLHKPFELFNKFNGKPNLLFKDTTPGLTFDPTENEYTKNYVSIFEEYDKCIERGNGRADSLMFSWIFLAISLIIARF